MAQLPVGWESAGETVLVSRELQVFFSKRREGRFVDSGLFVPDGRTSLSMARNGEPHLFTI